MDNNIVAAAFGLSGTVVGGLITYTGQWTSARADRRREETAAQQARVDLRSSTATAFLVSIDEFRDAAQGLWSALHARSGPASIEKAHAAYLTAWQNCLPRLGPTQIAGPAELSRAGATLHNAAADFSNALDDAKRDSSFGGDGATAEATGRSLNRLDKKMMDARRDFADCVRRELGFE